MSESSPASAGTSTEKKETGIVLNSRQKQILISSGYPDSYEELNQVQKDSITAIEELFEYVESKYNISSLQFIGYSPASMAGPETLNAYPSGGSSTTDAFQITRDSDGTIRDNYLTVLFAPEYTEALKETLAPALDNLNASISAAITETDLENSSAEKPEIISESTGNILIVLDQTSSDLANLNILSANVQKYLEDAGFHAYAVMTVVSDDNFSRARYLNGYQLYKNGWIIDSTDLIIK